MDKMERVSVKGNGQPLIYSPATDSNWVRRLDQDRYLQVQTPRMDCPVAIYCVLPSEFGKPTALERHQKIGLVAQASNIVLVTVLCEHCQFRKYAT